MTQEQKSMMIKMREEGLTLKEIGEAMGVTKQCVCQALPKTKRGLVTINRIKYKGIREYLLNSSMSITRFIIYIKKGELKGGVARSTVEHYTRMLTGKIELRLTLAEIRNILELTGLTYDKAFKEE